MENIIQNPGLQHITEMILLNLDLEDLKNCQLLNKSFQLLNKSCQDILDNPMFWLRKWRTQRGLSEKNHNDWANAIQWTRNTNVEANIKLYLQKVIEIGHIVDVPCFIDADTVEKSTGFTFEKALEERDLGVLQILASMEKNPNPKRVDSYGISTPVIGIAAEDGHLNVIKILAPITKDPNSCGDGAYEFTPITYAAHGGHVDIIKFLVSFTNSPIQNPYGMTPIHWAAITGHIDVLKVLAPLTTNPNGPEVTGLTPIQMARQCGHHEFARILQSYINTGHF